MQSSGAASPMMFRIELVARFGAFFKCFWYAAELPFPVAILKVGLN
jgi:hypothetical protein